MGMWHQIAAAEVVIAEFVGLEQLGMQQLGPTESGCGEVASLFITEIHFKINFWLCWATTIPTDGYT